MKNILKKATAQVLAGFMIFGTLSALPLMTCAEQAYEFYDDFEGVNEQVGCLPTQWEEDINATATFKIVEENGNKFARMIREEGKSPYTTPILSTKDGLVDMPLWQSDLIVVEARMRTNAFASRKSLRLGYPKGTFSDYGSNKYNLFMMRDATSPAFYYLNGNVVDGTSTEQTTMSKCADKKLEANTWYEIKSVIDPTTRLITNYLKDDTMTAPIVVVGKMDSEEYNNMENIPNITFKWVTPAEETMDVDNIKLYYVFSAPTAKLITDESGEVAANAEIGITFDKKMDETSLNVDTVKLYGDSGEVICGQRRYDSKTKTYYIKPDINLMPQSNYHVELGNNIYAANSAENYETGRITGTKTFAFVSSRVKSVDVSLSSIKVNSKAIEGFNAETLNYKVDIQYEENLQMPQVSAVAIDENAKLDIIYPTEVKGDILINVTAEDGISKRQYKITLNIIGEDIANLGKNMIKNSGFELGTLSSWTVYPTSWKGFLLEENVVHDGKYAALSSSRTDPQWLFKQEIPIAANKTYLLSGWVKLKNAEHDGVAVEMFPNSTVDRPNRGPETIAASSSEWKRIIQTVESKKGATTVTPTVQCWTANIDYYVDDLYVGELKPIINYSSANKLQIPKRGEMDTTLALVADIVNQFGTKNGLKDEIISEWRLVGNPYGVKLNGNILSVASDADHGKIQLEAVMNPKYLGSYANEITKIADIELLSNGDNTPQAKQVSIEGKVVNGETLTLKYRYYHAQDIKEGETQIQWMYSTQRDTGFKPIVGATNKTYMVTQEHAEHYIRAQIIPKTIDGKVGIEMLSSYVYKPVAPIADNVKIVSRGMLGIGDTLKGEYSYWDENSDKEGATTFSWLRSDMEKTGYIPIEGATKDTYVLTENDADKYIKFAVTPVSNTEPFKGNEVTSAAVLGPMAPTARDVSIEKMNSRVLRGSYKYEHQFSIVEGESICKWYVDDRLVETGISYEIDFSGTKTVRFEVTPVASKAPFKGKSVFATIRASKDSSSSQVSGGRGGGGGNQQNIVPIPTATPTKAQEKQEHWASEAIIYVMDKGIMANANKDEFLPEELVTRADFMAYIIKALGLGETEYKDEFKDVESGASYARLLQTAVEHGIISHADEFYPERFVARDEICKILTTGIDAVQVGEKVGKDSLERFSDKDQIAPWSVDYVGRAVAMGLLNGVSETEFMPKGQVNRAQAAVMVMRIMKYIEKEKAGAEDESK